MTTVFHTISAVIGPLNADLLLRLLLTLVLCGLVGLERSRHERASGFRPHILVGLGACLMTLAGAYGFSDIPGTTHDPSRIASYVVSGIGFLGAGVILRHGTTVRGITTAATLWGVAGIGIAVGAGLGGLAAVTVLLVLFTLRPLQALEAHLHLGHVTNELAITLTDDQRAVGKTLAALNRLDVPIGRASLVPGVGSSAVLRVELSRPLDGTQVPLLVKRLLGLHYIEQVNTAGLRHDEEAAHLDEDEDGVVPGYRGRAALNVHDETLLRDLAEEDSENLVDTTTPVDGEAGS